MTPIGQVELLGIWTALKTIIHGNYIRNLFQLNKKVILPHTTLLEAGSSVLIIFFQA